MGVAQVEPVKWAQEKTREVLSTAVEGIVTPEMILAAGHAVQHGYEGSISR